MTYECLHDLATTSVLAWSSQGAHMQHEPEEEVAAEVDEPPDNRTSRTTQNPFKRTMIRKPSDTSQSLLTQALHHYPDGEDVVPLKLSTSPSRRRSMNSNISVASTADLTSDTGLTSPARTNTPSPPPPVFRLGRHTADLFDSKPNLALNNNPLRIMGIGTVPGQQVADVVKIETRPNDPAVEVLTKKRCISFACAAKPEAKKPTPNPVQSTQLAHTVKDEKPDQRRTCIKFACPAKPTSRSTPPQVDPAQPPVVRAPSNEAKGGSPSTLRKYRSPSTVRSRRSLTPRRSSKSPLAVRKKYLTANSIDLKCEASRFHEFASDEHEEEDWIRQNFPSCDRRLTINDTLQKENEIRRLGKEAEEEALQEEEEDEDIENEDEDDADQDDEEVDEDDIDVECDIDDDHSGYGTDDDASDGYNTDNEIGFADSDDDGAGGELDLWTHGQAEALQLSQATPITRRRPSISGNRSDSSMSSELGSLGRHSRERSRRIRIRPGTPELPDSTDFVCGTLDEDRPLEDAYISCIAQRRREKLHLIPQDIDPSFPTSDPEDQGEDPVEPANDSEDHVWIHGEIEDLHHEQDRNDRRKKRGDHASPKRYHSPPPKRHNSPVLKARGRSPQRLFDRHSPRRMVSPPPPGRVFRSPPASPAQNAGKRQAEFKTLASRPGLTHTKSLPRAPAVFSTHYKGQRRNKSARTGAQGHVRGAIDIVKGLEHKRQRRREKFLQKHCTRARKGQVQERRPQPGQGAERMREIGLIMAGKIGHGNYVLSI